MNLIIRWDRKAIQQFADAIEYIEEDFLISADKFKQEILKKLDELLLQPERYQTDKFKNKIDGSYRAFEIFSYRISYCNISNQICIIRLRQTKMNPQHY